MSHWLAPSRIIPLLLAAWLLLVGAWLWPSYDPAAGIDLLAVLQEYAVALVISLVVLIGLCLLIVVIIRSVQQPVDNLERHLGDVLHHVSDTVPIQDEPLLLVTERINRIIDLLRRENTRLSRQLEQQQQLAKKQSQILQSLELVIWEVDAGQTHISAIQGPAERLFHHTEDTWREPEFFKHYLHVEDYHKLRDRLQQTAAATQSVRYELRLRDGKDEWRWVQIDLTLLGQSTVQRHVGVLQDITAAKQHQQQAVISRQNDALTGIGNRVWFIEQLETRLEYARHQRAPGALFFLDLDRFEFSNSVFGQAVGDQFLQRFAAYLAELFSESGVVGRLGGDEFGVILPNTSSEQAIEYVNQLLSTLHRLQFAHEGSYVPFSTSVGIALFPEHGSEPYALLTRAAVALRQAKARGRGTHQLASGIQDDNQETGDAAAWEKRLREAVDYDLFTLYFQPIIDLDIGVIHYYECLLRLIEPNGRAYGPGLFMNAAEHLGLRDVIEQRALVSAIRAQGIGNRSGHPVSLTINLSNRQLNQADLVSQIRMTVKEQHAKPQRIVFEINAKSAANNMLRIRQVVTELRKDGFRFAWDDFGVGALSFADLRSVPFDYIKIDGDLTTKIVWSPADRAMVKAIVDLAQGLDMALMAESVETEHMLRILRDDHVTFGQGRLFADPAPRFHEHERIIVPENQRTT